MLFLTESSTGGTLPVHQRTNKKNNGRNYFFHVLLLLIASMAAFASIRYDHMELIFLYGYLKLADFCHLEMACSKWRYYALSKREVSLEFSSQMDMSDFQSVYDFSSLVRRKVTLQKELWFNRRKIFCKLSNEVLLTGFDDYSCRIGIDILVDRTDIVKFTINNSFKCIPCNDRHRPDYEKTCNEEVDLAGFLNKLSRSELRELCFHHVPHLGRDLDGDLQLHKLTTLKIVNCFRVDMFQILDHCYHLQTLHYITDDDCYGREGSENNRKILMEIIDETCKQLQDVCLCLDTVWGWGIDDDLISKYHGKIAFTLFNEMEEYYAVYTELKSL